MISCPISLSVPMNLPLWKNCQCKEDAKIFWKTCLMEKLSISYFLYPNMLIYELCFLMSTPSFTVTRCWPNGLELWAMGLSCFAHSSSAWESCRLERGSQRRAGLGIHQTLSWHFPLGHPVLLSLWFYFSKTAPTELPPSYSMWFSWRDRIDEWGPRPPTCWHEAFVICLADSEVQRML